MNAVQSQWNKLKQGPLLRGAGNFFSWWREELVAGLPERVRDFVDHHAEQMLVRVHDEEVIAWRENGDRERLASFYLDNTSDEGARQILQDAIGRIDEDQVGVVMLIDASQVLRHKLSLPVAALERIDQVLRFEMDRHTPFKAEQVYFDYRILGHNAANTMANVELVVVLREVVDAAVKKAQAWGLKLTAVDAWIDGAAEDEEDFTTLGVNLLPATMRAPKDQKQVRINVILALMFIGLLYGVMWHVLAQREAAVEALRAENKELVSQARSVADLRKELEEAKSAAEFLSEAKQGQPVLVEILAELTAILPDEVWVQRLQLNDERVTILGQAPAASSVIALLESAQTFQSPAFKGAVVPDPASGKERFTIETTFVPGLIIQEENLEAGDGAVVAGQR